jgi:hypothetical protein
MLTDHPETRAKYEPRPAWSVSRSRLWPIVTGLILLVQTPFLILAFWPPREMLSDFVQDWASARNVLNGLPTYTEHAETIPRYFGPGGPAGHSLLVNAHPPTSVLLFLPFATLDYRPALLAWNLSGLAMLGVSFWVVRRQLGVSLSSWPIFPPLCLLLVCFPLIQQLTQGQLNLVLMLLITGAWASERSGRAGWAGTMIGAATAIKLFPGFLFLYFVLRRQRSALIAGSLTLILLTGLTAYVLGPGVYPVYVHDVLPRLTQCRTAWSNASLVGFWTRLFNPATYEERVEPLWRCARAALAGNLVSWVAVVSAVSWTVRRASSRVQLDHAFAVAVTGMLLLSPTAWPHSFLLLLVPIAILAVDPPRSDGARLGLVAAVAALWLWNNSLCDILIPGGVSRGVAAPIHSLTILSYQCYSLMVIFILCTVRAIAGPAEGRASIKRVRRLRGETNQTNLG